MIAEAKQLCKKALTLIKTAKHEYYLKLTEEADIHNMWSFCKWTSRTWVYTSPALSKRDGEEPVVTHSNKCNLLRTTLFPPQPQLTDEPPIDLEPRTDDMTYQEVTKQEVCDALFTAAPMNTPGLTGMTGKAYQWTWSVLEEELYHLIWLCARMGYHPKEWCTSIAVALQKPKRDYSLPRSYHLIQLLEVLGKVLEHVQACRLSYIAARHNLYPASHFGGITARSAKLTLLYTAHEYGTACNRQQKASSLTL